MAKSKVLMVTLEKMARLAEASCFDSLGQNAAIVPKAASTNPQSEKMHTLGSGTKYDICTSSGCGQMAGVCHSFTHDGRCISLFKTLYTNHCTHQCSYCTNSSNCSSRAKIFSYTPKELARLTFSLYRSNYVEGLFLSSGSGRDQDAIMEKLIETARLLRHKYNFSGYIHLKILPGASIDHIKEAMEVSTRVSINLEASSSDHMSEMCSTKDYCNDILQRQRYIKNLMEKVSLPAGQTTQLVVGGTEESDQEIFDRILYEYQELKVKRAYYSAFSPQKGTSFASREPQPLWREHRLYQMDWLYRIYHFRPQEIKYAFDEEGNLSNSDPKEAIAKQLIDAPVDPNAASYRDLLLVPGIGPGSAQRIIAFRKKRMIIKKEELASFGVRVKKAAPFLVINGWRDTTLDRWLA
jgi:predicted DNA-binding helix-hairpin-helix protein